MKKIIYTLLFGLTITSIYAMENSAEDAAIADLIAEISNNKPQKEFNNDIEIDLKKLEDDIERAQEYHAQEKAFEAKEQEKAKEATALLELISQEANAQQNFEQSQVSAPVELDQSEVQIAQEINQDQTIEELDALERTEQEILQEPALQDEIQDAFVTTEDIQIG